MRDDTAAWLGHALYWEQRASCARTPADQFHALEMMRMNFESAQRDACEMFSDHISRSAIVTDIKDCWTPASLLSLLAGIDEGVL